MEIAISELKAGMENLQGAIRQLNAAVADLQDAGNPSAPPRVVKGAPPPVSVEAEPPPPKPADYLTATTWPGKDD